LSSENFGEITVHDWHSEGKQKDDFTGEDEKRTMRKKRRGSYAYINCALIVGRLLVVYADLLISPLEAMGLLGEREHTVSSNLSSGGLSLAPQRDAHRLPSSFLIIPSLNAR